MIRIGDEVIVKYREGDTITVIINGNEGWLNPEDARMLAYVLIGMTDDVPTSTLSTVVIQERKGLVPADTAEYGWELFINGRPSGLFKSKKIAEDYAKESLK